MDRTTASPVIDSTPAELRLNAALQQLLEAHEHAQKLGRNVWQFALEISYLCSLGPRHTDLRWLVWRGYVEHGVEETMCEHTERVFRRLKNLMLTPQTCVVLTPKGVFFAQHVLGSRPETTKNDVPRRISTADSSQAEEIPVWDGEQHTLFWRQRAVRHFKRLAPAQEGLLKALEAHTWRHSLSVNLLSGLCGPKGLNRQRLRAIIENLSRGLRPNLRIRLEGNGSRVDWEALE